MSLGYRKIKKYPKNSAEHLRYISRYFPFTHEVNESALKHFNKFDGGENEQNGIHFTKDTISNAIGNGIVPLECSYVVS